MDFGAFFRGLFRRSTKKTDLVKNEIVSPPSTVEKNEKKHLTLDTEDLMRMAQKLVSKGELQRAEELLRDGVKGSEKKIELWQLLLQIEEPLKRLGRAYYCVERIVELDPENEIAIEKEEELKCLIDQHLNYYIEYKLAPEFYKLR